MGLSLPQVCKYFTRDSEIHIEHHLDIFFLTGTIVGQLVLKRSRCRISETHELSAHRERKSKQTMNLYLKILHKNISPVRQGLR